MRRKLDRELAILLEVFEQRCVDQDVIGQRYFDSKEAWTRVALSRLTTAGDLVVVTRKRRHVGYTTLSVTEQGLRRLQEAGLAPREVRYDTVLPEDRVKHQLAMNTTGYLLGVRLTHEHLLVVPDAVRAKSRVLPDAMFETTRGRRIYVEMDTGNYRLDRFKEKIDGMKDALGGWCELWIVTPDHARRTTLINELGEMKHVSWFTFEDVAEGRVPAEVEDAARPYPTPEAMLEEARDALERAAMETLPV